MEKILLGLIKIINYLLRKLLKKKNTKEEIDGYKKIYGK